MSMQANMHIRSAGPLRHVILPSPRYTTAPFSFMLQRESILTLLNLSGEDYRDLLIAFFSFWAIFFFLQKECLTIFIYLEINWDGLHTYTNDFLRFTTVMWQWH